MTASRQPSAVRRSLSADPGFGDLAAGIVQLGALDQAGIAETP
jgi:hypothetical protein